MYYFLCRYNKRAWAANNIVWATVVVAREMKAEMKKAKEIKKGDTIITPTGHEAVVTFVMNPVKSRHNGRWVYLVEFSVDLPWGKESLMYATTDPVEVK